MEDAIDAMFEDGEVNHTSSSSSISIPKPSSPPSHSSSHVECVSLSSSIVSVSYQNAPYWMQLEMENMIRTIIQKARQSSSSPSPEPFASKGRVTFFPDYALDRAGSETPLRPPYYHCINEIALPMLKKGKALMGNCFNCGNSGKNGEP